VTAVIREIEDAHASIGGTGPGRRFATVQLNHAYAVLLASQFQGFCRDLHSECITYIVRAVAPALLQSVLRAEFRFNRGLDKNNANPATLGSDFNRLGVEFWVSVSADNTQNDKRKKLLEEMNSWRNAIAHEDFDPSKLGGSTTLHLKKVRRWRRACNGLANSFDKIMGKHIEQVTGVVPW
jgi:hypothetical protein